MAVRGTVGITEVAPSAAERLFEGDGEMRALCRALDWGATPLGPVAGWSHSLRTTAAALLASRHPMFLFWGPELVQLYNDAYRPSLGEGGRHPRALGMRGREFWTDIWDVIGPQIEQVMTAGVATWHEDQLLPIERNGRLEEVYWTYSYSPVRDDDGSIAGTLVVCQETTSRVVAERRLATLHGLTALPPGGTAAAAAAQAVAALANDRRDVSFALCYLAPVPGGDVVLAAAEGVAAPPDPARWPLMDVLASGRPSVVALDDWPSSGPDATWPEPPVAAAVLPLERPGDARRLGALVVGLSPRLPWDDRYQYFVEAAALHVASHVALARDEMERERLLAELRVERSRLEFVFHQAPSFLAVLHGPRYVFTRVNDAYYQLVGHRPLLGRPAFEALPELRAQGFEELLDRVVRTGTPFHGREVRVQLQRAPGAPVEERYLDFSYLPLVEADGRRSGVIAHGTDVTDHVRARRDVERLLGESEQARAQLEQARAQLELANQSKSEFLAVMSHELRTPLNAIAGYAELLTLGIHGELSDPQRDAVARIQAGQRRLLGLINQVLSYSRMEAGAVSFHAERVALAETIAECVALVAPQAQARGLTCEWHGCDGSLAALADHEKLQQVVLNLLSNAVKFTGPGGRVTVSCAAADERVLVRVRDTGRGIAPEQLERVFEPFVQVDASLTRMHEGAGLGLAISRDLARGMGGDLTLESRLGEGSTFTLALPRG